MIGQIISLIQQNKIADASDMLSKLPRTELAYASSAEIFELIKALFQKDLFNLYLNLKRADGWTTAVHALSAEDSLSLISQLPSKSQIAGYLLFQAIASNLAIDLIYANNTQIKQLLFSKIIHPNIHEETQETPLLSWLIEYMNVDDPDATEQLVDLLQQDASLIEKDVYGITPLHIAAKYNKLAYLKPEPSLGNTQDIFGNTLLHYAIKKGNLDAVKQLVLDWKANVNLSNSMGLSPLMLAASMGQKEIAQFLLEHNADIH